ncbi:unnamed protein product [Adineta ricciae]|uniref:Uncharacterized protein n=1 Tax=Adineta ricciae TaxID=249248 RepID=A0A815F455_ADIRI|nr:unnamed protein product [Adineta ricciae]
MFKFRAFIFTQSRQNQDQKDFNKVYYGVGADNNGKHSISHPPRPSGGRATEQLAIHTSVLPTAIMSMPILWVICMAGCTTLSGPAFIACIATCAPLLPAPTP